MRHQNHHNSCEGTLMSRPVKIPANTWQDTWLVGGARCAPNRSAVASNVERVWEDQHVGRWGLLERETKADGDGGVREGPPAEDVIFIRFFSQ